MKIPKLLFVLLSAALFACGSDVDIQPGFISPDDTTPSSPGGTTPSSFPDFTVSSHFAIRGDDNKKAEISFGINHELDGEITIAFDLSARVGDIGPFYPIYDPLGDATIRPGTKWSGFINFESSEINLCVSSANIKLTVTEVRYDGQVLPVEDYTVLGINADGTTVVRMTGTGRCNQSGDPTDSVGTGWDELPDFWTVDDILTDDFFFNDPLRNNN